MFRTTVGAGLLFLSTLGFVRAQGEPPTSPYPNFVPATGIARPFPPDIVPVLPNTPPQPQPQQPGAPANDFLNDRFSTGYATQTAGGGYQGRSYNEEFDGDFPGIYFKQKVQVGVTIQQQQIGTTSVQVQTGTKETSTFDPRTQQKVTVITPIFTTVTTPVFRPVPVPVYRDVQTILAGRYSGIMITDNDSPRPTDRTYFGYSYYDGLGAAQNPGFGDTTQNRQLFGFEKTLFGGDASIGLRMPYVQVAGPFGSGGNAAGDLSILGKWALINNRETGDLLSVGMVLTTPTGGQAALFPDGTQIPHSVLFQPWVGAVRTMGRGYLQNITNFIIPADSRDVYLFGTSFAMGYRLNDGSGVIPAITPTFETHVRIPMNDRDPNGLIYLQDQVNLTGGAHFRWNRFTLSGAACVPVLNPRPWNIEALANLNYRF